MIAQLMAGVHLHRKEQQHHAVTHEEHVTPSYAVDHLMYGM